jgi:hypothetical protein
MYSEKVNFLTPEKVEELKNNHVIRAAALIEMINAALVSGSGIDRTLMFPIHQKEDGKVRQLRAALTTDSIDVKVILIPYISGYGIQEEVWKIMRARVVEAGWDGIHIGFSNVIYDSKTSIVTIEGIGDVLVNNESAPPGFVLFHLFKRRKEDETSTGTNS